MNSRLLYTLLLLCVTACATTETPTGWLNDAQKIDEERDRPSL